MIAVKSFNDKISIKTPPRGGEVFQRTRRHRFGVSAFFTCAKLLKRPRITLFVSTFILFLYLNYFDRFLKGYMLRLCDLDFFICLL